MGEYLQLAHQERSMREILTNWQRMRRIRRYIKRRTFQYWKKYHDYCGKENERIKLKYFQLLLRCTVHMKYSQQEKLLQRRRYLVAVIWRLRNALMKMMRRSFEKWKNYEPIRPKKGREGIQFTASVPPAVQSQRALMDTIAMLVRMSPRMDVTLKSKPLRLQLSMNRSSSHG